MRLILLYEKKLSLEFCIASITFYFIVVTISNCFIFLVLDNHFVFRGLLGKLWPQ